MGSAQHSPKNARMTVVGAGAVALLGMLGGMGAWWGAPHQGSPIPQRILVSAVDTTTTVAPADQAVSPVPQALPAAQNTTGQLSAAQQQLMGLIPPGYGPNSCQGVTPPATNAVATVDCANNTAAGGPTIARYSLFSDQQGLDNAFNSLSSAVTVQSTCPDGTPSPNSWHWNSNPNQPAGQILCGSDSSNSNNAVVAWTENSALFMAGAEGPNASNLLNWWNNTPLPTAPTNSNKLVAPRT
jgi:serine/threonine kinase PknH